MQLLSLLLLPLFVQDAQDQDWPCWRGVARDGVSTETGWSPVGAPLWTADVGLGYSCPSIADGVLYVLGHDEEAQRDVVRALDAETGAELWSDTYPAETRAYDHEGGSLTTPAVADGRLYVACRDGALRCYEAESGRLLWFKDLLASYELAPTYYGYSSSPVVEDGLVFLNAGDTLALDAVSGDLVWRAGIEGAEFSTPAPLELAGASHLAVFGQEGLHVLDRESGTQTGFFRWHQSDRLVNASTPVVVGERVYISSAYDHGCALIDLAGEEPTAVWQNRNIRNKMAGCVQVDGGVFGFDESLLKCVDLETGEERWRVRGLGNGALIAGDGKLIVLSSKGELIVAEASTDEWRELSRARVVDDGGVFWAPPVLAGGRIYVRSNRGTLAARDHRPGAAARAPAPAVAEDGALPEAGALFAAHLEAIGGEAAVRAVDSLHATGTFEMRSVGFRPVPLEVDRATPDLWRVKIGLPPPRPGSIERMYDGELAYEVNQYLGHTLFEEAKRDELAEAGALHGTAEWAELYPERRVAGLVTFGERPCWRVETTSRSGAHRNLYFDRETGLLAGRDGPDEDLVLYDDYRPFGDVLLPAVERRFVSDTGIEEVWRIEEVRFGAVDPARFERPQEIVDFLEEDRAAGG